MSLCYTGDSDEIALRVFDLQTREFIVSVSIETYAFNAFRDANTLYHYDVTWDESERCTPNRIVLEITLP